MIKVDLITGFLGSGKTTFLKLYAGYLVSQGENICILENDYGAVNVDMMLIKDSLGDKCDLEMVSGGCDNDCHKRRFKTKLISMGMRGYDRVIIEPSGIFDIDEFFDTLHEEPLDRWYEIVNVIAIVEADLPDKLSEPAEFLLASQVLAAGSVVVSKLNDDITAKTQQVMEHVQNAAKRIHCQGGIPEKIYAKKWTELTNDDFCGLMHSGYHVPEYEKQWIENEESFQSVYLLNSGITLPKLPDMVDTLMQTRNYGNVFRIKGFIQNESGEWLEINAASGRLHIEPVREGQEVLIIIGEHLQKEAIEAFVKNIHNYCKI